MKYLLLFVLFFLFSQEKEKRVYVCKGSMAYAYHTFDSCEGLARCSKDVVETSLDSAVRVFGKNTLCGFCRYKENK